MRRLFIPLIAACLCAAPAAAAESRPAPAADLGGLFQNPPAEAKPWVFWFWMHGHVTREGITADLEAMAAAGIGGAVVMQVRLIEVAGPVAFGSPEFFAMYEHSAKEAARLGMQLSVHPLEGWCALGGPWNKPEHSMKKTVWTGTTASGPGRLRLQLPQPEAVQDFYQDAVVVAHPAAEDLARSAKVSVSAGKAAALVDAEPGTATVLGKGGSWAELEFSAPREPRSVVVTYAMTAEKGGGAPVVCNVMVPDENGGWRTVSSGRVSERHRYGIVTSMTFAFDPIPTSKLRLAFQSAAPVAVENVSVFETERVDLWENKAGKAKFPPREDPLDALAAATVPPKAIAKDRVIDLTKMMRPDGTLEWDAPPGEWNILRIGYTTTGATNKPSSEAGKGLETDKMSRSAVNHHIDSFGRKLIDRLQAAAPGSVHSIHTDSWEIGPQTWTAGFSESFRRLRGYDPTPYLPVLAGGAAVGSRIESNRFLWDVRRTWADLIKTDFFEELRDISHGMGILYQSESTGTQMTHCDPINYNSVVDIPIGEFWLDGTFIHPDCKISATVANTYNKPIVGAEAYTSMVGKWKEYPASLKALGDKAFCIGINRYMVHRYAHQPWLNYEPGMNFGPYGMNFERTVTWWKPAAGAWSRYLARCQALLQQGHTVADVAVLLADDIPTKLGFRNDIWDPIPAGVDYDGFNLELLGRLTVDADGMLCLPHGPRYRMLLLPNDRRMRPETLREIARLVEAGATVIGPPPLRSPSLMGYPDCDREVRELAARLWGNADGQSVTGQRFGKGRVIHGRPLAKVLAETGPPDFDFSSTHKDAEINYIHRRTADADIYFVASAGRVREKLVCCFRVNGRAPELFDPASGGITRPALYRVQDGVTEIPLDFAPSGSVFVVFRDAASGPPLVDMQRDGKPLWGAPFAPMPETDGDRTVVRLWDRGSYQFTKADGSGIKVSTKNLPDPLPIVGPWSLHFPPGRGAPEKVEIDVPGCWTKHPDEGVRHFSGTATYRKTIELPEGSLAPNREWHLDLVLVNHVAEVSVNGQAFPVLWKPPYMLDVTAALKPGRNEIAIAVTNLWLNRLIGDDTFHPLDIEFRGNNGPADLPEWVKNGEPPPGGRTTFATWRMVRPDDPLSPSGLRGPVTLRPVERVIITGP